MADPLLGTAKDPPVAVIGSGREHAARITPRADLREAEGAVLARRQARTPAITLGVRAERGDHLADHVRHRHGHGRRRAASRDLHHRERVGHGPRLGAAVRMETVDGHQPALSQLTIDVARNVLVRLVARGCRREDLVGEFARRSGEALLLRCGVEHQSEKVTLAG